MYKIVKRVIAITLSMRKVVPLNKIPHIQAFCLNPQTHSNWNCYIKKP